MGALALPLQVASAGLTILGKINAGQAAAAQAEAQAAYQRREAGIRRATAQRAAQEAHRRSELQESRYRAVSAASGGGGDGSARSALQELAGLGRYNALAQLARGEVAAQGDEFSAGLTRFRGRASRRAANLGALQEGVSFAGQHGGAIENYLRRT